MFTRSLSSTIKLAIIKLKREMKHAETNTDKISLFLARHKKMRQVKCALGNELTIDKWDPPNSSFDSSCC